MYPYRDAPRRVPVFYKAAATGGTMLELRILVDNIDYDSIAEYLIPVSYTHLTLPTNREV